MSRSEQIKKDKIRIGFGRDSLDLGKRLETLPGKREIDKKRIKRENLPFLPKPMGRPAVELSLAPPRAAERRELSGNCAVGGSIPGKRQKSATPGTRTRASERRGRKNYPLGYKIAVLKMANKTLRARRKKRARAASQRPRPCSQKSGGSETKGPFPNSLITK